MLKFSSYIFLVLIFLSHSTVFSQEDSADDTFVQSGDVFIEFAKDYLEDRQEDVEEIITPHLQDDIVKITEAWTVKQAEEFLKFLQEHIGPGEIIKSIRAGFRILDFQAVTYRGFRGMADLFIEHIGKDGLSVKLLRRLDSHTDIMPETIQDPEDIEQIILFIKEYVEDEDTAIEIIVNNDIHFVDTNHLEQLFKSLEEKGLEKTDIIEVMRADISKLHPFFDDFEDKVGLLLGYGFSSENVREIVKTGQLDEVNLDELIEIIRYLERADLEKRAIISIVTKNLAKLRSGKLEMHFFDLKEVLQFLGGYIGRESINEIASRNFMFFSDIVNRDLKQVIKGLESYGGKDLVVQFVSDLSVYDHYGVSASDNFTSDLRRILSNFMQGPQIEGEDCPVALN